MRSIANVFALLIIGLIVVAIAKRPAVITDFFNGTKGNLSLLTQ